MNLIHTYSIFIGRPKWVTQQSTKYAKSEYVLISWQDDDLPVFGRIDSIVSVSGFILFSVNVYRTLGIDHHYHSFVVTRTTNRALHILKELQDYRSYQAHMLSKDQLYITYKSYVEKH